MSHIMSHVTYDITITYNVTNHVSKTTTTGAFAASTLWSVKVAGKREVVRALVHWGPQICTAYGSRDLPSFKEAVNVERVHLYPQTP